MRLIKVFLRGMTLEVFKKYPNIKSQIKIHFRVCPRDFMAKDILLPSQTIHALNKAAETLKNMTNDQYELVLTRGYVYWGRWRRFRGTLAKVIFYLLCWADRADTELLFGHNGHNDGLSVDVQLYDIRLNRMVHWLSWKNIIIPCEQAKKIIATNKALIDMLDTAMISANFTAHSDPREKLQMHYRLNINAENLQLMSVVV